MKQYLLIPISEIDSSIEELNKLYKKQMSLFGNSIADVNISELNSLKSKGEIVEDVSHTYGKGYKLIKTIK